MVNFVWQNGLLDPEYRQSCPKPPLPIALRGNSSDKQVLAQVEKWMARIRELSREPKAGTKLSG